MSHKKDLTGLRFGKLLVIELAHRTPTITKWKCKCDCGNITYRAGTQLTPSTLNKGYNISCGCTRKNNIKVARWTGYKEIPGTVLKRLLKNASIRHISVSIDPEYMWNLFLMQNRRCALSGESIKFVDLYSTTASLDRIDSSKGYEVGNVQWVHKIINSMKWDLPEREFTYWCQLITTPVVHTMINESYIIKERSKSWRGVGNIPLDFYTRYRKMANKRSLQFDVSINELWKIFLRQRGYCAVTGLPILVGTTKEYVTASIDRIDNTRGYTVDNIQWIHKTVNVKIKKDMLMDDVYKWCNLVVENS